MSNRPPYCDCDAECDASCKDRHIERLDQACQDLDEALQQEKAYKEFSDNVAAYNHLIANEIDAHRIKMLEGLKTYYMEDNK